MRGAGGAPAFADAVLGAGESGAAGNQTAAGRVDPGDSAQQAAAKEWLESASFERLASHVVGSMGAHSRQPSPAAVGPHQPTPGDPRFAVQHPGAVNPPVASGTLVHPPEEQHLRQERQPQSVGPKGGGAHPGVAPGDKRILQRPAPAVGKSKNNKCV